MVRNNPDCPARSEQPTIELSPVVGVSKPWGDASGAFIVATVWGGQ